VKPVTKEVIEEKTCVITDYERGIELIGLAGLRVRGC
jgi:hypothetical protein